MTLKTFVDHSGFATLSILEDNKSSGRMVVRGVFQRADTKNANGRIYSSDLWEKVLADPKVNDSIASRRMLGEIEHPTDGTTNLARVSHIVTKIEREGDTIYGEAEILNTPSGMIVQELFRSGVQVGISSRGRGTSYINSGVEYVNESDFQLDTFDFVYKPSTPGAFPELQESVLKDKPFSKGTPMSAKLTELKRIEVRATDIAEEVSKKIANEAVKKLNTECVELDATLSSITSNLEEKDEEAIKLAENAAKKIAEARLVLTGKLDELYTSTELDRKIDSAVDDKDSKTESNGEPIRRLLSETRDARDHFAQRVNELEELLESSEDELTQRFVAARGLAAELLSRLDERDSELAEIREAYEALEQRHEAAVALVAGVAERQDRARIVRTVREAIEMHPELQKFSKTLLSCKTESEVVERLNELKEAMGLLQHDAEDIAESQVNLSAALVDSDKPDEEEVAEESDSQLPEKGAAINESSDADTAVQPVGRTDVLLDTVLSARNWN